MAIRKMYVQNSSKQCSDPNSIIKLAIVAVNNEGLLNVGEKSKTINAEQSQVSIPFSSKSIKETIDIIYSIRLL